MIPFWHRWRLTVWTARQMILSCMGWTQTFRHMIPDRCVDSTTYLTGMAVVKV
ncbi:MAG: hypothetical protein ACLTKE_08140 [Coprococcus sp.]